MKCKSLADLLRAEMPEIKSEFIRHKYFMSKEAGHDVGIREAEADFVNNHLNDWAEGYKKCYCELVCQYRDECDIKQK